MTSFMRMKDGKHPCQRCEGKGCFSCAGRGMTIRCPGCGSIDGFASAGDEVRCNQCGTIFDAKGTVSRKHESEEMEKDNDFEPME